MTETLCLFSVLTINIDQSSKQYFNIVKDKLDLISNYSTFIFSDKKTLDIAKERRYQLVNIEYERNFKAASTIEDYDVFVRKFIDLNHDPKDYINESYIKMSRISARLAQVQENNRQEKLKTDNARFVKRVKLFRKEFSEGDFTHCGLVAERKNKVAQIQTMNGSMFISISQLYPQGVAQCSIYNGVYQAPVGLAI